MKKDLPINSLYGEKNITEVKEFILSSGINKLLESNGLKVDELLNSTTTELKNKFGVGFLEFKKHINGIRKNNTESTIKDVKNLIELILVLSGNYHEELGEHLREKQKEFIINIFEFLIHSKHKTGYIHSATGTGKTVMFTEIIKIVNKLSPNKKILILTPSKESLYRAKEEFDNIKLSFGVYYSEEKDLSENITIMTKQSLSNLIKNGKIKYDDYSLILADEIHDGFLGEDTETNLDKFNCKKVGFTATPELLNKHVGELFEENLGEYLIEEAIEDGYLPQINTDFRLEVKNEEYDKLKLNSSGDYTEESLESFDVSLIFEDIKKLLQTKLKQKQIAIFLPSVKSSKRLAVYLNQSNIKSTHIDGKTPDTLVKNTKEQFEKGEIQIITSCDKMAQSWDSDIINGVIIARPTLSPAKYLQMLGRALHGKEMVNGQLQPKKEVIVVDIVNSKQDILSRNITSNGLKTLFNSNKKGSSERKISLKEDNFGELLLYYDFDFEYLPDFIEETLEKYRELYQIEETEFYYNLQENINYYDDRQEKLEFKLISNSKLGQVYANRVIQKELTLKTFLTTQNILNQIGSVNKSIKHKVDIKDYETVELNEKNQYIDEKGVVYTAITHKMKVKDFPELPNNGQNILRRINKLLPEEQEDLKLKGKKGRIGSAYVELYNLEKIRELFSIIELNNKNQYIDDKGVIYTAITNTMKVKDFPELPDNGQNILRKIKKLPEEEQEKLKLKGKKARFGVKSVDLYNLEKIRELFGIIKLNEKKQYTDENGVVYTVITKTMKKEEYPELPDNGANIFRKIKKLSEEEQEKLKLKGKKARFGVKSVDLYNLEKIRELFGGKIK